MKKTLSILMAALICAGSLAGCSGNSSSTPSSSTPASTGGSSSTAPASTGGDTSSAPAEQQGEASYDKEISWKSFAAVTFPPSPPSICWTKCSKKNSTWCGRIPM